LQKLLAPDSVGDISASEVPDDAPTNEEIGLVAAGGVHIQVWRTRPEISYFTAQAEVPNEPHIQSPANLEHTGGGSGIARGLPSEK
jgi:hypothetical protein